jgi:hypothetical protein
MFVNMAREVEGDSEEEEEVQEGATTSDEEMEDEIKRAQAAVDECYRRWARRAGISIKVTEDRLLTEEELDSLSEQLGDRTGARARRRKEIEKMLMTEMEAEIEEVQKKIKKGKPKGAGRLPLVLTLLCLMGNVVEGFTAYDCSNRSNIVDPTPCWNPTCAPTWAKRGRWRPRCKGDCYRDHRIPVLSAASVTRYIRFREPKTLEAWE